MNEFNMVSIIQNQKENNIFRSKSLSNLIPRKDFGMRRKKTKSLHFLNIFNISKILPPTFSSIPNEQRVSIGGSAIFESILKVSFPFKISWYKNNIRIRESKKFEISFKSILKNSFLTGIIELKANLKILCCSVEDIGNYKLLVKNTAGNAFCSAVLNIEGN